MNPRNHARDLGYAVDAIKPFEDLSAYELARRVRIERAIAVGETLSALAGWVVRLPARLAALATRRADGARVTS
jgi:hypothetical protein